MRIFKKGEEGGQFSELDELKETVLRTKMPPPVEKVALKEIEKLAKSSGSLAEATKNADACKRKTLNCVYVVEPGKSRPCGLRTDRSDIC